MPGADQPRRHGVATIVISRCEGELDVNELKAAMAHPITLGEALEEKSV